MDKLKFTSKGLGILVVVSAGLALVPAGNSTFPNPVPCSQPQGVCPDLIVDPAKMLDNNVQTSTFSASNCEVEHGQAVPGVNKLLRFYYSQVNVGDGDLLVGNPAQHPEWFVYNSCHGHYHFREYADYRLWTIQGYIDYAQIRHANPDWTAEDTFANHPELLSEFVAGNKQGFCVIDLFPYSVNPSHFFSCGFQGITHGWADEYVSGLSGQWVNINGVASDVYMLEAETNSEHLFTESDYTNNSAAVPVLVL